MADLDALRYAGFGSKFIAYDTETIQNTPFEAFLTLMIRDIKTEIEIAKSSVEPADKDDEVAQAVLELLDVVELLKTHLELTLEVMQSSSKKEVQAIKEKYPEIKDLYEKVQSKEDFAPLITKTALATFHDKLILVLDQVLRRCFKNEGNSGLKLIREEDDYAMVKILTGRFRVAALHYPITATIDRNDIINQPRDSKIWQETYKSAELRHLLSKQEAATSFKLLYLASNLSHIIVRNAIKSKGVSSYRAILSLMREILYYGTRHTKAQIQALLCLIDPQAEEAFRAWNMIDNPIASKVIQARLPYLGFDKVIYIPRMFPQITKEVILREYKEGTINKIDPTIAASIKVPPVTNRCKVLKELLRESEDKIPVRILSHDYLGVEKCGATTIKGLYQETMNFLMSGCKKRSRAQKMDGAVILHMHGGGFVAMSSASMRIYTARWCKNLKMVHFSIDHRLAPKNPYPDALDDIWQTYLWIINYSESVLGIKAQKVIFAGDSSGANLAMAITLRIIHAGLQPPHGCLLVYPCLKVDLMHSTPSLFSAIDNPMLHMSLLKLCIEAYIPEEMDGNTDPYISPEVASDELLKKMPPLRIVTGSEDPFQDDNWRTVAKLRKLNRDVKIVVHQHLSHAFMCHQDLKNFKLYIEEACDLVRELVRIEPEKALKNGFSSNGKK